MQPNPPLVAVDCDSFPISAVVREGDAVDFEAHMHACGQLVFAQHGPMLLETRNGIVRMGPDRAAWLPAGEPHAVFLDRRFRYHSLYIDSNFCSRGTCGVFILSSLLRELIIDVSLWPESDLTADEKMRRAHVIVDEIVRAPRTGSSLRIPDDKKLGIICRAIERDTSIGKSFEDWAVEVGVSTKTLQRLFLAQTGMAFQQWRNHARMTRALELQMSGMRELDVALAVGYATEGSYAQAFKKFYGHPPSFLKRRAKG
ncbi:AraC family transcriptional regulator [Caballeronia sp. 15715]|uniref:AraC family transcriptional regulator n=1 Tax=Caballeronia sp. 15715 TaxID=3391030 RepID=UPI0039E3B1A9